MSEMRSVSATCLVTTLRQNIGTCVLKIKVGNNTLFILRFIIGIITIHKVFALF
jgi:hypothetical protein